MIEKSRPHTTGVKTGVIICVAGDAPKYWSWKNDADFRDQLSGFDAVRVTTTEILPYQLQHLWMNLLSSGIMHVVIKIAEFTDSGKLELSGKTAQLPFIQPN